MKVTLFFFFLFALRNRFFIAFMKLRIGVNFSKFTWVNNDRLFSSSLPSLPSNMDVKMKTCNYLQTIEIVNTSYLYIASFKKSKKLLFCIFVVYNNGFGISFPSFSLCGVFPL